jgi:hypothetical protein
MGIKKEQSVPALEVELRENSRVQIEFMAIDFLMIYLTY